MRKRMWLLATAITALTVGPGLVFAQAPGASEHKGSATSGANSGGMHENMQQKGSNARGAQGEKRETTGQAGQKAPNARGAQGEKRETTGQAPNERNNRMGQENKLNKSNKSQTTGQAPNEQRPGEKSNRTNNAAQPNERNRSTTGQGTMENRGGATSQTRGSINLSSEQRTRIHTIIVGERGAPRVGHVDFDVRVGTRIPRGRVHFAPLPRTIVDIEPSWRGYEYFLVGDQIVVVNPRTLEIVAVLPA